MDFRAYPRYHLLLEQPQSNPNGNVPQAKLLIIGIAAAAVILTIICLLLIYLAKCSPFQTANSNNSSSPKTCPSCNIPTFIVVVYHAPTIPPFSVSSSRPPSSPSCIQSSFDQTTCFICLDEFSEGEKLCVLPECKHSFHKECIEGWIPAKSLHCPVCRDNVLGKKVETLGLDCHQEVVGLSQPYLTVLDQTLSHF